MAVILHQANITQLASELWPEAGDDSEDGDPGGADDLEKQIAKEVESMKRPRKEQRFGMSSPARAQSDPEDRSS